MRIVLLALLLLVPCATAQAAGEVYTVAGTGTAARVLDGDPATRAGLLQGATVAPLPGGGFLVGSGPSILRVDPQGVIRKVAGSIQSGFSGDGGPALRAELTAGELAPLPGGGFLFVDPFADRVRMVDPSGVITTVAGGGTSRADGVPATQARLTNPNDVAAAPGGGFVVALEGKLVRRVGPDGRIATIAGDGTEALDPVDLHGQPATSVGLSVSGIDVAADGGVLIAEGFLSRIDRVAPDGTIAEVLRSHDPGSVAAEPGGGLLFTDGGRVLRRAADGTQTAIAGGGPFTATAPRGLEQRLTGAPASGLDTEQLGDVAPTADGGVLFATAEGDVADDDDGALVRYIAPPAPGMMAAAVLRDRDRVFAPGRAGAVSVALTLPATVTLTVAGHTTTQALGAGVSRLPLPPLRARPHMVSIVAVDGFGRRAFDRARVFPSPWLPEETAALVAVGVKARVLPGEGTTLLRCTRAGAVRVDCDLVQGEGGDHCGTATISFVHGRLRWGAKRCLDAVKVRVRLAPRVLRRRDWTCGLGDRRCPPRLFGRLAEAALVPSA